MTVRQRPPGRPELLRYGTYGGWLVQRFEHGTLGRWSPDMTRPLPGGAFELKTRLDRAAYQLFREAGLEHQQALHNSLLTPAWSGLHNAPARGIWEMEIHTPEPTDRIHMVAMLWPEENNWWPLAEVNITEGRLATGETLTNLHWPDPDTGEHRHDPVMIPIDHTTPHRYRVQIDPGRIRWYVDGRLARTLESPHVPHTTPVHMVLQAGVDAAIQEDWHPDYELEHTILLRPLKAPHNNRKETS